MLRRMAGILPILLLISLERAGMNWWQSWEARGRPLGSPEVDWLAAERSLYEWLVAKGVVSEFPDNGGSLENALYH
jgi:hypothetical protein